MDNTIFISYAKEDFLHAEKLYNFLLQNNYEPWMDKKNLLPGQNWEAMILTYLRKADFIILLLSSRSVDKRGYIQKEFKIALDFAQEKLDSDVYVIPVKLDDCDVPDKLQKYHWIDYLSDDYEVKLLAAIEFQKARQQKVYHQTYNQKINPEIKSKNNSTQIEKAITSKSKLILLLIIIFSCLSLIYYAYSSFNNEISKKSAVIAKSNLLTNKEDVYLFLVKYFNSVNEIDRDAHDFFANEVDHYILKNNLTPADINSIRKSNTEFIDNRSIIDKGSLNLYYEKNRIKYWRFWNNYSCYRPSKKKFETCNVLMEFGINSENKITSIKEISIQNLKFSKIKPS